MINGTHTAMKRLIINKMKLLKSKTIGRLRLIQNASPIDMFSLPCAAMLADITGALASLERKMVGFLEDK